MSRPKRDVSASVPRLDEVNSALAGDSDSVEAQVTRPKRPVVIATRNKLVVKGLDDKNFHYHWFIDRDDNIANRLEEGYTFVGKDGQEAGDRDADYSQSNSSLMTRSAGLGQLYYLMRIPLDHYKERQAALSQKDAKDREDYIKERMKSEKGFTGRVSVK